MRIGLFPGTFNPPHFGHLQVALESCENFKLEELRFIPTAHPPHKDTDSLLNSSLRVKMLQQALKEFPELNLSLKEIENPASPHYTIDTLKSFAKEEPGNEFFLIIGEDAFLDLHKWKDGALFLDFASLIVNMRPQCRRGGIAQQLQNLFGDTVRNITPPLHGESAELFNNGKNKIFLHHVTPFGISSSIIRKRLQQGKPIDFLVPSAVLKLLSKEGES